MTSETVQAVKITADVSAYSITAASFFAAIPTILQVLSIIWLAIQIGDWGWKKYKAHKAK